MLTTLAAFTTSSHTTPLAGLFSMLPCCCFPFAALLGALGLAFWVWMIVDCANNEPGDPANGNNKLVWILVIALTGWVGGLIYYFVRRPERRRLYGK